MKKTICFVLILFAGGISFGQAGPQYIFSNDSTFYSYKKEIYALPRAAIAADISNSDTLTLFDESSIYVLKYIETIGNIVSRSEIVQSGVVKTFSSSSTKYGENYLVISYFLNTGALNQATYYYQKLE